MLLLVVLVAPLGIGAGAFAPLIRPVARQSPDLLLEVLAFSIAGATFLSRSRLRSPGPLAVPIGSMIGIAALGALQIVPIPQAVLRFGAL